MGAKCFSKNMQNKILVIASHPDDEVLGCGGTLNKHIQNGDAVKVVTMTDGVGARNGNKKDKEERSNAFYQSLSVLGINEFKKFDFPDNQMDTIPMIEIVKVIEEIIMCFQPSRIYTHHPGDLNIDHRITFNSVITACRPVPGCNVKEILCYEVLSSTEWAFGHNQPFVPNFFIDISKTFDAKITAFSLFTNECMRQPHSRSLSNITNLARYRGNTVGVDYAEAFTVCRFMES